jgi:hypothetical protein
MSMKTYHASCHCGAIEFEVGLDLSKGTLRCNCSLCRKARAWFAFTPPDQIKVLKGDPAATEYLWTPPSREKPNIHYHFCPTCGVRTFAQADDDGKGNTMIAVNVAALDNPDDAELAGSISYVDGRHDHFDREPDNKAIL